MDVWTFNKLAAATLLSLLVIFGGSTAVTVLYPTGGPGQVQIVEIEDETEVAEADTEAETEPAQEERTLPQLLAAASVSAGERVGRECSACHVYEEGGANRVGPNLYGVVGRQVASVEGFNYSSALQEYGGEWSYERLDCFLENPSGCVQGTSMGYAGIKDPEKRANMIAYLASLGDAPPFPEPEAAAEAAAETQEAPAETDAAAAEGDAETETASASEAGGAEDGAATEEQQTAAAEEAPAEEGAATADMTGDAATTDADPADTADATEESAEPAEEPADTADAGDTQLAAMFANASAAEGEKAVRVCSACHLFQEGGGNRVGPNLYGIVGREVASVEGFRYSSALQEYGGEWTYEKLNCFLENPRECVAGTSMAYAGVKDEAKRANIIAYLASLGEAPPLPGSEKEAGEAEDTEDAAKADEVDAETKAARLESEAAAQ